MPVLDKAHSCPRLEGALVPIRGPLCPKGLGPGLSMETLGTLGTLSVESGSDLVRWLLPSGFTESQKGEGKVRSDRTPGQVSPRSGASGLAGSTESWWGQA